ncbi:MAG: hypothetical protein MHMPM18_003365 [Marteilia pararefringens]
MQKDPLKKITGQASSQIFSALITSFFYKSITIFSVFYLMQYLFTALQKIFYTRTEFKRFIKEKRDIQSELLKYTALNLVALAIVARTCTNIGLFPSGASDFQFINVDQSIFK